jgi:hypothetical protein
MNEIWMNLDGVCLAKSLSKLKAKDNGLKNLDETWMALSSEIL